MFYNIASLIHFWILSFSVQSLQVYKHFLVEMLNTMKIINTEILIVIHKWKSKKLQKDFRYSKSNILYTVNKKIKKNNIWYERIEESYSVYFNLSISPLFYKHEGKFAAVQYTYHMNVCVLYIVYIYYVITVEMANSRE